MMAHSLTVTSAAAATATKAMSGKGKGKSEMKSNSYSSSFPIPKVWDDDADADAAHHNLHASHPSHEAFPHHHHTSLSLPRRALTVGLSIVSGSMLLGWGWSENASAAARRPPPPPAEEKKDPNVSGVQAKVLASKKRKEAMKQSVAKLREKGKLLQQPPQ